MPLTTTMDRLQSYGRASSSRLNQTKRHLERRTLIISSTTAIIKNSTLIHKSSSSSASGNVLLAAILVPLLVVFLTLVLLIVFCVHRKNQQRKKRENNWRRNEETSISWFEAFEFPQSLKAFNEFSEPADYSIPMGPLCINNFGYENYDPAIQKQITGLFSANKSLNQELNHNYRKSCESYPVADLLATQSQTEKKTPRTRRIHSNIEFENNVAKMSSHVDRFKNKIENF